MKSHESSQIIPILQMYVEVERVGIVTKASSEENRIESQISTNESTKLNRRSEATEIRML
jgi:hypothetical protein